MTKGVPTNPAVKAEILDKVKNQGVSVYQASKDYHVSSNAIRNWLTSDMSGNARALLLENNRLKKELDNAYRVIGKLSTDASIPKGWRL